MRLLLSVATIFLLAAPSLAEAAATDRRTSVVEAVQKVSPAVVNISTEQVVERPASPFGSFRDPFFEEFFREFTEPRRKRFTRTSLGSGVIVRPDGYILTNQHVILKGSRIHVALVEDREFQAELVGTDSDSDLAVLRIQSPTPLPYIEMGTSDDLMIGETVIAIGNPFGLSHTVTTGVVSAVGRTLQQDDQTYYDFIQTDASINPGNSGGPLLNILGELIGINTAIYRKAQGIGFAIPVDRARHIVSDLISYGEVQLPWVGAIVQSLTPDLAAHFRTQARGVLVRGVERDSPASRAGIVRGDIITAIDSHAVRSRDEYQQRVRDHASNGRIDLTVIRDGSKRTITVRATAYPVERADELAWQLLGIQLTERQAGLSVRRVRPGSSAARIGIRKGDRVVAIAGAAVRQMGAFRKKMIEVRLAQGVMLSVQRGRYVYNVAVPLKKRG